jgi:tetratricopeptide (TPR) repeat protein
LALLLQLPTGTASDYALPQVYRITGKVVVGHDEPVMVVLTLTSQSGAGAVSTQSFANGTFRFNNVPLGTYRISVVDPRFNLFDQQLLLREPRDTGNELTVRLTPRGEKAGQPPDLDVELYAIDAESIKNTPPKAMEDFNKGVSALRNPSRNNPPEPHFKRAISAAPQFYEAHLHLGLEQLRQKKGADAIQTLERASSLKPDAVRPRTELGRLYWEAQKYQQVIDALSKLDELGKMTAADHYHLGSAQYKLDHFIQAQQHLESAIELGNETDPSPFLQLHNVYMRTNQPLRGLQVLEEFLKLFPNDPNHAAMTERVKLLRERLKIPG